MTDSGFNFKEFGIEIDLTNVINEVAGDWQIENDQEEESNHRR